MVKLVLLAGLLLLIMTAAERLRRWLLRLSAARTR